MSDPSLSRPTRLFFLLTPLLALAVAACDNGVTDPDTSPIDGTWVRAESTNNPNDGMRVEVADGQAVLTFVPTTAGTAWSVGQVLWRNIAEDTASNYNLQVLGSDGNYYDSTLILLQNGRLEIDITHTGAGGDQTWQRP